MRISFKGLPHSTGSYPGCVQRSSPRECIEVVSCLKAPSLRLRAATQTSTCSRHDLAQLSARMLRWRKIKSFNSRTLRNLRTEVSGQASSTLLPSSADWRPDTPARSRSRCRTADVAVRTAPCVKLQPSASGRQNGDRHRTHWSSTVLNPHLDRPL